MHKTLSQETTWKLVSGDNFLGWVGVFSGGLEPESAFLIMGLGGKPRLGGVLFLIIGLGRRFRL
ncbi:hypothetical protein A2U01_0055947, partial [Trifolium medium]|nr:hypothetical protein [Trifolium medium]